MKQDTSPVGPESGSEVRNKELLLAGFWLRFLAAQIDLVIFITTLTLLMYIIDVVVLARMGYQPGVLANSYTLSLASLIFYPMMESSKIRATPGKRLLGLEVVDLAGNRISNMRASCRHVIRLFSGMFFMLGFVVAATSKRKQGAHDWATRTLVIRTQDEDGAGLILRRFPLRLRTFVFNHAPKLAAISSILVLIAITRVMGQMLEPVLDAMAAREKLTLAVAKIDGHKQKIAELINDGQKLNDYLAENKRQWIVQDVNTDFDVKNRQFSIRFVNHKYLFSKKVFVKLSENNGVINWHCSAPDIDQALLPPVCIGKQK